MNLLLSWAISSVPPVAAKPGLVSVDSLTEPGFVIGTILMLGVSVLQIALAM